MTVESAPSLALFREGKETKWPFVEENEEQPEWEELLVTKDPIIKDLDYALVGIGRNPETGEIVIAGKSKKSLLVQKGDGKVEFIHQDLDFGYLEGEFPIKIMDRLSRNLFTLASKPNPLDNLPIGAKPTDPKPALSASVALKIPK